MGGRKKQSPFVCASHMHTLLPKKLTSVSSAEMYERVLLLGVRCVELDIHDGQDGVPELKHGGTLTTRLKLADALGAIRKHAFAASDFPLILSLEVHCSLKQQAVLAKALRETFGEALLLPDHSMEAVARALPSPYELRRRVIVKAKAPLPSQDDDSDPNPVLGAQTPVGDSRISRSSLDSSYWPKESSHAPPSLSRLTASPARRHKRHSEQIVTGMHLRVSPELTAAAFLVGKKSKAVPGFAEPAYAIASFGETIAEALAGGADSGAAWMAHNNHQLSRVYPRGSRVDSSNNDPTPLWDAGAQLVALNYQTCDEALQLSRGRFRANGNSGYVLKPAYMRALGPKADHLAVETVRRPPTASEMSAPNTPPEAERRETLQELFLNGRPELRGSRSSEEGVAGVVEAGPFGTPGSMIQERWVQPHSSIHRQGQPCANSVCSPAVRVEVSGGRFAGVTDDVNDPLNNVEHGVAFETAAVNSNGLAPVWGERCSLVVSDADTAVLRIAVLDRPALVRRGRLRRLSSRGSLTQAQGTAPTATSTNSSTNNAKPANNASGNSSMSNLNAALGGSSSSNSGQARQAPRESDGALMAWQCVPLSALRNGYVSVTLRDRFGVGVRFASLLLHVKRTEHTLWKPSPTCFPRPSTHPSNEPIETRDGHGNGIRNRSGRPSVEGRVHAEVGSGTGNGRSGRPSVEGRATTASLEVGASRPRSTSPSFKALRAVLSGGEGRSKRPSSEAKRPPFQTAAGQPSLKGRRLDVGARRSARPSLGAAVTPHSAGGSFKAGGASRVATPALEGLAGFAACAGRPSTNNSEEDAAEKTAEELEIEREAGSQAAVRLWSRRLVQLRAAAEAEPRKIFNRVRNPQRGDSLLNIFHRTESSTSVISNKSDSDAPNDVASFARPGPRPGLSRHSSDVSSISIRLGLSQESFFVSPGIEDGLSGELGGRLGGALGRGLGGGGCEGGPWGLGRLALTSHVETSGCASPTTTARSKQASQQGSRHGRDDQRTLDSLYRKEVQSNSQASSHVAFASAAPIASSLQVSRASSFSRTTSPPFASFPDSVRSSRPDSSMRTAGVIGSDEIPTEPQSAASVISDLVRTASAYFVLAWEGLLGTFAEPDPFQSPEAATRQGGLFNLFNSDERIAAERATERRVAAGSDADSSDLDRGSTSRLHSSSAAVGPSNVLPEWRRHYGDGDSGGDGDCSA